MGRSQPHSPSSSPSFRSCWRRGPAGLVLLCGLLALQPHRCTSQSPSGGPTYEPTVLSENATDRPTVSPAPTLTMNPTREPAPSNVTTTAPEPPTDAPVAVASQVPSDVPTEGTVATGDPTGQPTTREPSPGPTTEVPSPGPTPTPGEPTLKPVKEVTPQPTMAGTKRSASLPNVVSFYDNVGELNQAEIAQVLTKTENWFMASFNNKTFTSRRYLQSSGLNPSQSGVRNVLTQLKFQSIKVDSQGLQMTYDQELQWIETVTSYTPDVLAGLPYNYNPTNQKLASILKSSVNGFENVGSPLTAPDFPAAPTGAPTSAPAPAPSGSGGSPLSTGAIVGIAVAGAVGLPLLCYGLYLLCGPGSDKDSTRPGGSTGYVSAGSAPPSKVTTSRDDVSAMDYPREGQESMADYQDQSVATVDYDYSKAYGGTGDNSVVSSAGGTMGENTRQTAGDPAAATLAARAALGASFDSELGGAAAGAGAGAAAAAGAGGFRDDGDGNLKEEIIEINAPAGKLGVVIDTPDDGAPVVHAVKDSSVIANLICVGDKLIAVDDEDVRSMTAIKVSKLISKKSMNATRKLTIVRTTYIDDTDG